LILAETGVHGDPANGAVPIVGHKDKGVTIAHGQLTVFEAHLITFDQKRGETAAVTAVVNWPDGDVDHSGMKLMV
jgi:hypothetical protein